MSAPAPPPALEIRNATKRFGGVTAIDAIDLAVQPGEVRALLGQNGSGKSTLVKILAGYHVPEPGAELRLWGVPVPLPLSAPHRHGVAIIHQDLGLAEKMTVLENLGVSSGYGTRSLQAIRRGSERRLCQSLIDEVGLHVDLDLPIRNLSPAQRAGVAIARATRVLREHGDRHVFIVDEPTTYLSAEESARMLNLIRSVARAGSSVIFITHRLQEAVDTADSITVLRDGRIADTFPTSGIDARRIIAAMLGRELESFYPDPAVPADEAIMRVTELSGETLNAVSFELIKGEIVGFAGLVGAGHEEVPYLLAGARDAASGNAQMAGDDVLTLSLRARLERGIVLVPGNRHRDGLWMAGTASENITLPQLREFRRPWGLDHAGEHCASRSLMERFGVRPPSPGRMVNEFSGGNQQKIVLAKWLYRHPKVLLLDEPTQGIDAGAKRELLDLMMEIAAGGTSILIASGDYEQLANVCNRVYVIRSGRLVTQLRGEDVTEDRITEQAQAGAPIVTSNATTPSLTRRDPHEKGPFET